MKKVLKIIGLVFSMLLLVYGVLFVHEMYYPEPTSKFMITCGWDGIIRGVCDKSAKKDHSNMTGEELDWVMQDYKVSKEDIIAYSKEYLEYRKEQIKEYEQGKIPTVLIEQISRLENIIKTLQE